MTSYPSLLSGLESIHPCGLVVVTDKGWAYAIHYRCRGLYETRVGEKCVATYFRPRFLQANWSLSSLRQSWDLPRLTKCSETQGWIYEDG